METGIRSLLAIAFAILSAASNTLAQPGPGDPYTVQEIQVGVNTEYNVINSVDPYAAFPLYIVAFAVRSTGGDPFTFNSDWTAAKVDATSWFQPMGGVPGSASWADYTRMTYAQAFPFNPTTVNGYVLDAGSRRPISPGTSLDGFFFPGAPDPTDRFLLVGAHGPAIVLGQRITDAGTVAVVPEPDRLGLCLLAFTTAQGRIVARRKKISPTL